jgi:hypothetical protein
VSVCLAAGVAAGVEADRGEHRHHAIGWTMPSPAMAARAWPMRARPWSPPSSSPSRQRAELRSAPCRGLRTRPQRGDRPPRRRRDRRAERRGHRGSGAESIAGGEVGAGAVVRIADRCTQSCEGRSRCAGGERAEPRGHPDIGGECAHGVDPQCSIHVCCRGLNNLTISPVFASRTVIRSPL